MAFKFIKKNLDHNNTATFQRLLAGNSLLQNLFPASIIPTSTCSSVTNNSSMAAMFAVAMNNTKNLLPNSLNTNSNVFEILNTSNSSANGSLLNAATLLNQKNNQATSLANPAFLSRQNLNLTTSLPLIPNNLSSINGNVDIISQIFQHQANAAAAAVSHLCFPPPPTGNSHLLGGSHSSPQSQQQSAHQQLQTALLSAQSQTQIPINLPPPPLPSATCLSFFPSTSAANLNSFNSSLIPETCIIPPPPPLQPFLQQVNLIYIL